MLTTIAEIAVTMSAPQPEERAAPDTHPALARFACLALAGDHARQGMLTRVSGDRLGVALGPLELAGTARALADGLGGGAGSRRTGSDLGHTHPLGYRADGVVAGSRARMRFARSAPREFDVLHGQGDEPGSATWTSPGHGHGAPRA